MRKTRLLRIDKPKNTETADFLLENYLDYGMLINISDYTTKSIRFYTNKI